MITFASHHFLIIGRAGMDFNADPPGVKIEHATGFQASLGGSSANIAAALCRLGMSASLVTRVSDDAIGRYCLNQLDAYGVNRTYVKAIAGEYRNSLAVVESCIEDHQAVIYRNGAADFQMERADVADIDYASYGALITTGTVLAAEPSRDATFHAFQLAKDAGIPLIFDVDYRPYSWVSAEDAADTYSKAAELCDVIVGNDVEFGFMAGDYKHGLSKARELARNSATLVVYKMGEHGAITFARNAAADEGAPDELRTGIYPVTALKPTGAGDSFMGGMLASLCHGYPLKEAVLRGSACASIVVSKPGCAPAMPTVETLNEFLLSHAGPTNPDLNQHESN